MLVSRQLELSGDRNPNQAGLGKIWGFPSGADGKESACSVADRVQSLGQEDPLEKEMANPPQYSCLENPMDRGAWQATVHEATRSLTQLSSFTLT